MKLRFFVAAVLFIGITIVAVNIVQAGQVGGWSPIKETGYAVTSSWFGMEVPLYANVVATAGTTDPDVVKVEFKWHAPNGTTIWDENVTVSGPLITPEVPPDVPEEVVTWATDNLGVTYWYAQNTHSPTVLGDWGVQAIFHNATKPKGNSEVNIVTRSTSINVIPEVPLGTIGIIIAMFGAFGLFQIRKRKISIQM